jgi:tRNA G18 (ribose-2'-O)-methylase SpoU
MPTVSITDASDDRVRTYRNLKDVAQRVNGCFIAESELVLDRILDSDLEVVSVFVTDQRYGRLASRLESRPHLAVYTTAPPVLDAVVGFPMHRGVLALVRRPVLPSPDVLLGSVSRVVVLEDVVDPDNVGSIFRHAAAFGADAVLLSTHAGDPLYRKAVRTSMGRVLDVRYARVGIHDDLLDVLRRNGLTSLAFTPKGTTDLRDFAALGLQRIAALFGAEAPGLRDSTIEGADWSVRIPIDPAIDSLNVATSAAIAMYELFR